MLETALFNKTLPITHERRKTSIVTPTHTLKTLLRKIVTKGIENYPSWGHGLFHQCFTTAAMSNSSIFPSDTPCGPVRSALSFHLTSPGWVPKDQPTSAMSLMSTSMPSPLISALFAVEDKTMTVPVLTLLPRAVSPGTAVAFAVMLFCPSGAPVVF